MNILYKVNYNSCWDKNGTHYNQTITIQQKGVFCFIDALNDDIATTLLLTQNTYIRDNLKLIKPQDNNIYYLTITQLLRLKSKIPFKNDNRVLINRNTKLIIK